MSLNKFFTKATHPETENHLWQTKLLPWSQCPPPGRQSAWVQSWTCWRKCRSMSQISQMIPHLIYPIHDNTCKKKQQKLQRSKICQTWFRAYIHKRNQPTGTNMTATRFLLRGSSPVQCGWISRSSAQAAPESETKVARSMGLSKFPFGKWWSFWGWKFQDNTKVCYNVMKCRQIDLKVLKLASKSSANA